MSKNIYFLAQFFIIFSPLCFSMEKNNEPAPEQAKILHTITAVTDPLYAFYISNNEAIIIGKNDHVIYNTDTQKIIKYFAQYMDEHRNANATINRQKNTLAVHRNNKLTIYDIPQQKQLWQEKIEIICDHFVFNSNNDTLFFLGGFSNHLFSINYRNNTPMTKIIDQTMTFGASIFTNIAAHPKKQSLTYISRLSLSEIINYKTVPFHKNIHLFDTHDVKTEFSQYNDNGDIIVFGCSKDNLYFFNTITKELTNFNSEKRLKTIKFIPNSTILTTISCNNCTDPLKKEIKFWNIDQKKTILSILIDMDLYFNLFYKEMIDITPNGTKLIVTDMDKCYIIETPLSIQRQLPAQKKCIFILLTLHKMGIIIPQELKHYIIHTFLAIS